MRNKFLAIELPDTYSRLYVDFLKGRVPDLDPSRGAFGDPGGWKSLVETATSEGRATPEFWAEFADHNARLGAAEKALENAEALRTGASVAVMGGQQPGLLGGALLVMYKAATIVALAEKMERVTGKACVPVFIVSGDDSDFAEISRCTVFDGSLKRLSLGFSQGGYRSGQMVGALSAGEERGLAASLTASVGDRAGRPFVEELIAGAAGAARDHGEFVGALISRLFSNKGLLVLEGRSRAMRVSGRELFESYLANREELALSVRAKGKELESRGYHAQLGGPGLDWWLFKIEDGLRKKAGEGGAEALSRGLEENPQSISPNVALRPLWRDSTFPSAMNVLGPSEVAYTIQIRDAYRALGVSPRGIFPRMSVTLVPAEGEQVSGAWGSTEMTGLIHDFEGTLRAHYRNLVPAEALEALETSKSSLGNTLGGLARALREFSGKWEKGAESVRNAGEKGLSKLENDIIESKKRGAENDNPRLKGLGDFLAPDGRLQERSVSMLYPLLELGEPFVEDLMELARTHVSDCSKGDVRQYCYRLGGEGD